MINKESISYLGLTIPSIERNIRLSGLKWRYVGYKLLAELEIHQPLV